MRFSRFISLIHVLLAVGMLTGCTSLVRTFNRIYAGMTKEETNEESNNYGAFFRWSLSSNSELPKKWSGPTSISSLADMPTRRSTGTVPLVSCPRNSRYIAGGQLAVFQGANEAPISESYGSSEQRGKTANWPRPKGLR